MFSGRTGQFRYGHPSSTGQYAAHADSEFSHVKSMSRFTLHGFRCVRIIYFMLCAAHLVTAQDNLGLPNFGTSETHQYDTIDLSTLNVILRLPVRDKSAHYPMSYGWTGNNNPYTFTNRQGTKTVGGGMLRL